MSALSVKGIGRRFRDLRGRFSVTEDLLVVGTDGGATSLQSGLLSLSALPPVKTSIIDCDTKLDAAYSQIWTHIIVKVKLVPQELSAPIEMWKQYWKMGIEGIWNRQIPSSFPAGAFHQAMGRAQDFWLQVQEDTKRQSGDPGYWTKHWACSGDGEVPTRLQFEVQWVESQEDHVVHVVSSADTSDESSWILTPSGAGLTLTGAAHEFGHMLGFPHDRIPPNGCEIETSEQHKKFAAHPDLPDFPWRRTVMCAVSVYGQLPGHLVEKFADALGSRLELMAD
jgi:hypothetical protein